MNTKTTETLNDFIARYIRRHDARVLDRRFEAERITKALRTLADEGFIVLDGTTVTLADKGRAIAERRIADRLLAG